MTAIAEPQPTSERIGDDEARGVRFYIPAVPPSMNSGGIRGRHWSAVSRQRQQWSQLVGATIGPWLGAPLMWPVQVRYVSHYSGKAPDLDNIAATSKVVLDALEDCGVLADDNDVEVLAVARVEARSRAHRGIEVEVVEL